MRISYNIVGSVLVFVVGSIPSFASAVATNGTWYNFKTAVGVDYGAGVGFAYNHTSASGFYSDPGTPPWTFTATGSGATLTVTDGGESGDVYNVYDNGSLIGSTSAVDASNPGSYACGDFPEPCAADSRISKGTFQLGPGAHSITISVKSSPYPDSSLSWFKVTAASGCDFTLGPGTSTTFTSAGGTNSLSVTTTSGCSWTATSSASWLTIVNGASGTGSGSVQFLANTNLGTARAATIDVSGKTYTVTQAAGVITSTPDNALILSQFVGGGTEWHTTLFLTNLSNSPEAFTLRFYDDAGLPRPVPMSGMGTVDSITATIGAGQSVRYETNDGGSAVAVWGLLTPATAGAARISGLAVFRQTAGGKTSEAVVDLAGLDDSKYVLLYDNLGSTTSAAFANPDPQNSLNILAEIRNEAGAVLRTDTITLPPLGHTAFALTDRYVEAQSKRGSIRFVSSPKGFAGLGLRFSQFGTFTSFRFLTSDDIQ